MDYWWHFINRSELQDEMLDIQRKLINFGIPFLEHPETTWRTCFDGSNYTLNPALGS
jgi:hypothetical protein